MRALARWLVVAGVATSGPTVEREGREVMVGGETFERSPFRPRGFACITMRKPSPSVGQYWDDRPTCNFFP